jgi:phosphonate transport system substrate-binding protein
VRKFHFALATARAPLLLPLLLLALLLSTAGARAASERTFSVGIVPPFETRQIYAIWTPILDELQQRTGYRFELSGSPSIPEFEKQFSAGLFDFAYMNPYHLLLANNRQGYVPLVRDVGADLQGVLVVKKGGVKNISELEGKSIAFPAPNSLAASLLLRAELRDKFMINHHSMYVKSHSSVYLNVLLGLAAAGGGVQRTLEQQPQDIRDGLEILYRTERLAPHPFTAHPRVATNIRTQVQQALLDFAATSRGQAMLAKVPIERLGVASYEDYAPIARLGLDRFYLQE